MTKPTRDTLIAHLRDHHDGTVETLAHGDHNHAHSHGLIITDEELARKDEKGKLIWSSAALETLHEQLDPVSVRPLRTSA